MENLTLDRLVKRFGNETAVDGLSLTIPEAAFVALLGPSGCGKTTILRLLAGFEKPTSGSIHLGDRRLADARTQCPPEQRNMAMVFQSYALWPHMSVAENVGYPLKVRGTSGNEAAGAVRAALAQVEMERMAQRRPAELSGGQRQRVALARCLVAKPRVVLLDEPLANLDRNLRDTMEGTFREFHRQTGATLVYVTHDQSEAMSMADYIAVMRDGRLAQWATPEQLYQQPVDDWVARFIGQGAVVHIADAEPSGWLDGHVIMQAMETSLPKIRPVLLRPEHIRIGADGLSAEVRQCVYRGERYELTLSLLDGQPLRAWHHSALATGQSVRVRFDKGWSLQRAA
ncbi:ABC transporter ATP-binding protein [Modicisalibacter radicis]|uniref:ABC transporter ATP-binding protein n=1 Tax=Halomonas sp. EAR18 TaxID=2518972 RepID=UPI00109CB534|nr:ABC transporter ATP-binding protein [Halomonas sp. EAR18]